MLQALRLTSTHLVWRESSLHTRLAERYACTRQAMHDGWHGAPRFPRPLHHGRQEVLGTDCEVLVMQVPRTAPHCPALPRTAPQCP